MPQTLAEMVRAKYPGAYDDLTDVELEASIDSKYPGTYADLPRSKSAPTEPPAATAGMLPPSEVGKPEPRNMAERFALQYPGLQVQGDPIIAPGIVSLGKSVASGAAKYGFPALKSVAGKAVSALEKPWVGGTLGAIEGARHGGVSGAIEGGVLGAAASRGLGGRAKPAAPAAPADPLARMHARLDAVKAQPVPMPKAAPKASTLSDEVMARNIDWRTTDAVPIDAMKRSANILEAGESQIGLAERLATAMKHAANDPKAAREAELLSRALRQRMHIREGASARAHK